MKKYERLHKYILEQPELKAFQESIDKGVAFHLEGSWGRTTMDYLKAGLLLLGENQTSDYWGNTVPAYTQVVKGHFGTPEYVEERIDESLIQLREYDYED